MRILYDRREQQPFDFTRYAVDLEPATLATGDYSLPGFEDRVAVERKGLNDLIMCCMGSSRDRFERELARGRAYEFFAVVIEASLADVARGRYRSAMKPKAALQSVVAFQVRYRVPFVWAGGRPAAEYLTFSMLQKFLREIEERFKQAVRAKGF